MDNETLQAAVKTAFASEFSFYLKAHNFHWNVEGPDFVQFHELFETIYSEVYGSIDDFAENIRKIGAYTPASLSRFSMLTEIADENAVPTAQQMAQELLTDSDKMADVFKVIFTMAEDAGEHGLSNFIADRQDAHRKHSWMLRSILK
jgi:starvation-inducible DNA-binding protein